MDAPDAPASTAGPARRRLILIASLMALLVIGAGVPALQWQRAQATKTSCLSTERRLSTALLLYGQDHDYRLPPPDYPVGQGKWRNWVGVLEPYTGPDAKAVCPVNPAEGAIEARRGYPFPYSYALNSRFFGVFDPGPFPLENLELAAQTVMLVEGGGFRVGGLERSMSVYTDTAENPRAYPSPHSGRMNVAAADGHVVTLKIAHYRPDGHDPLYGRLGGSIYDWNGGHPNGDTGGAPRE